MMERNQKEKELEQNKMDTAKRRAKQHEDKMKSLANDRDELKKKLEDMHNKNKEEEQKLQSSYENANTNLSNTIQAYDLDMRQHNEQLD